MSWSHLLALHPPKVGEWTGPLLTEVSGPEQQLRTLQSPHYTGEAIQSVFNSIDNIDICVSSDSLSEWGGRQGWMMV